MELDLKSISLDQPCSQGNISFCCFFSFHPFKSRQKEIFLGFKVVRRNFLLMPGYHLKISYSIGFTHLVSVLWINFEKLFLKVNLKRWMAIVCIRVDMQFQVDIKTSKTLTLKKPGFFSSKNTAEIKKKLTTSLLW